MTRIADEDFVAQPVGQTVRLTVESKIFYPFAVWELIARHILEIIENQPHINVVPATTVRLYFDKQRLFHPRVFHFDFEALNSQSMSEYDDLTRQLNAFFMALGSRRFGSDFERVDEQ